MPPVPFFPLDPAGSGKFRPLRRYPDEPDPQGWDAFCVQTLLVADGYDLVLDGWYGSISEATVDDYQERHRVYGGHDGIAGNLTQRDLLLRESRKLRREYDLPVGSFNGHLSSEGGFQTGVYTPRYPDGSYDLGPPQRNLHPTYDNCLSAFDGPETLEYLAASPVHGLRPAHDKYVAWGVENRRAWELAHAHWNRPAWADRLARGQLLTPEQYAWVQGYIAKTTAYITTWPA